MMTKKKLYTLTSADFALPLFVDRKRKVTTGPADNIPMISWPDGRWCSLANIFMLRLYRRGLSRRDRGGTLLTYTSGISHLIRYCYNNNIDFFDLSDNQFTLFIKTLQGERRADNPKNRVRNSNSVIATGRICLEFLATIGQVYQDQEFVGPNGRIRAEQKEFEVKSDRTGRTTGHLVKKYWHHRSFPTEDPQVRRLPISTKSIKALRAAVMSASNSIYVRKRRYVMLKLLEITGGRRFEVASLTVQSILNALQMSTPMLRILTVKKPGGRDVWREIPIARHDLEFLRDFIEKNRRRVIRMTCGPHNDDGHLLISETTGRGVKPNTLTQEIYLLAKAAGISEKACAHMFRHRFITKLFVALIEQHNFQNQDDFRRALLSVESIKQKVQQLTGHARISSLDVYINLAFEEASHFGKTYSIVAARSTIDSFRETLLQLRHELLLGTSPIDTAAQLSQLIAHLDSDLEYLESKCN